MKNLITLLLLLSISFAQAQKLTIVEQDFEKAKKIAKQKNKLLYIDFYTTWCGPCKKLDKWIFQNDTLSRKLGKDFILLRYDAEQDKIFNLTKKHHVNSYPTGIILNSDGFVVNRLYGFEGEVLETASKSIFEFTATSIDLNRESKILKGYSNTIDITKYPKFYIDFVNRDEKNVVSGSDFKDYWNQKHDTMSEEYFSTLLYFAAHLPTSVVDSFLENKPEYIELYGETNVNTALLFMCFGKFTDAVDKIDQTKFNKALEFMKEALGDEKANEMLPMFKKGFEDAKKE